MTEPILPQSAKRLFHRKLKESGYYPSGIWRVAKENGRTWRMTLKHDVGKDIRLVAVMWPYLEWWEAMIAVKMSDDTEFALVGGRLDSWEVPSYESVSRRVSKMEETLGHWHILKADDYLDCLLDFALFNLNRENYPLAKDVLRSLRNGEFSQATIEESLKLAYLKWGSRIEERHQISVIWWRIYGEK